MPTTELPLTDDDRDRLARKAARSIAAIRWGVALALVAHIGTGVFLSATPTDFSRADKLVLAVMLVVFAGVPLWLYVWDTRRTVSRVLQWRADGIKACLTGRVTAKPNLTACATMVIALSCSRGSGGQDPLLPVNDPAPARRVPINSQLANLPPFSPPDLTWDGPIGWEPRPIFPAGVTLLERQEGTDYVNLKYFPWSDAKVNALMLGALRSFETTALLMPHERLCEPAWIKAIEQAQPPRLLLRIEGDPTPQQWDCLQELGTSDLYLGLCHATNPAFWGCDGNLQLQALELRPQLRGRVRGLGVAFTKAELWSVFPRFPRLSHLTIRGSATREGPSPKLQADL
ncbi:MAG: hypothetical protein JKY37_15320, partial [Nannocystaceae bacterium]|nr:hypothetical protein [Nannocystaceae bacterium]